MNLQLLKRRAEMIDAVCTGLHPSAVIGQLSEKYGVSEKALWSDWLRREKWVPFLLELEKFGDFSGMVVERLNGVQKAAWSIYLKASNDSARVGALRTVLEALEIHRDIVQTMGVLDRLDRLEEVAKEQNNDIRRGGGSLH
ncbi:MAG: hypothetical protein P8X91_01515 [Candidatus Bathyarchaeota archaeon]